MEEPWQTFTIENVMAMKSELAALRFQLAQQAELLREAREVIKWAASLNMATSRIGKEFPEYVQLAQALLSDLEEALLAAHATGEENKSNYEHKEE